MHYRFQRNVIFNKIFWRHSPLHMFSLFAFIFPISPSISNPSQSRIVTIFPRKIITIVGGFNRIFDQTMYMPLPYDDLNFSIGSVTQSARADGQKNIHIALSLDDTIGHFVIYFFFIICLDLLMKIQKNGHISVILPPNEKIKALYFLQL